MKTSKFARRIVDVLFAFGLAAAPLIAQLQPGCGNPTTPLSCNNSVPWPACGSGGTALAWQCWQQELISTGSYTNGYRDLKIEILTRWSQNPAFAYRTFAYWAGKTPDGLHDRFVFRVAFAPFTGAHYWTSTCSTLFGKEDCSADAGLVTYGSVSVAIQSTSNPLWTRGFLKQDSSYSAGVNTFKPPSHYDGTFFFWHGDTAWAATVQACRNQWRSYIDNRKANAFTVVHLALSPRWAGPPAPAGYSGVRSNMSNGQAGFQQIGGTCPSAAFDRESKFPNCSSRWNPGYWQELDGMIQYANQQGILVYLVGASGPFDEWISDAAIRTFSRNLAAMTRGNFVILSPGFDDDPTECEPGYNCAPLGRRMSQLLVASGDEIRTLSGTYPIITNHYATVGAGSIDDVHPESWLNVNGYQSGFSGGNLANITSRPRTFAQAIRYPTSGPFANPRKPALNAEAIYDYGYGVTSEASTSIQHFNRYRLRQAGWSSWFAGATGYSWGQAGLWEWGLCGLPSLPAWATDEETCVVGTLNPPPTPQSNEYKSYAGAMCQLETAVSARRLGDGIRTLDFGTLAAGPAEQNRATSSPPPTTPRQFVLARDADNLVVYMPHNANVRVNLAGTGFESGFAAYLYNTRAQLNMVTPVCAPLSGATYQFENPGGVSAGTLGTDDWVLLLGPGSSIPCSSSLNEPELGELGFFMTESEEGIRGLWAHVPGALEEREAVLVEGVPAELPRRWSAARDGSGNTLVVWEHRQGYGTISAVHARWLDANAQPLGEVIAVSPVQGRDQLAPSVAVTPDGEAIVAWVEHDPVSGSSEVLSTGLSIAGAMGTAPARLDRAGILVPRRTRAICDAASRCYVAWESENRLTGAVSAKYRSVDARSAFSLDEESLLRETSTELWLGRPELDARGNAVLSWEEFDPRGTSKGRFASLLRSTAQ
ncbi:MAG: DUF4038 domain-containing protein [Thermoanaerobaculia bacterium]|jgi:hypothetical protein|nr:DUF4038 domain-containing protein [Thermoanaerobaculia bacterium]